MNQFQKVESGENKASPRKMMPIQMQKMPIGNIKGNNMGNKVGLSMMQNNLSNNNGRVLLRVRNGVSPISARVGARPVMMVVNTNNRLLVPTMPY